MKISYFSGGQYTKGGTIGKVIDLNMLISIKQEKDIKFKSKEKLPFIQGQSSGKFMIKEDVLSYAYYENWDGIVFMDVDSPKDIYKEVCSWWTDDIIFNKIDDIANALKSYKWFRGISISGGGHGWHILGQIKSRWNSESEYMATYIQVYNDIYSELCKLFNDRPNREIKSMCDGHNIYPYQKFYIGGKKFIINNAYDDRFSYELNDYSNDSEYLIKMKNNCDIFIVNQVMDQFNNNIINKRNVDINNSKIDKVTYTSKYSISKCKPLYNDGVPYFNNVYRFMLVKTLKCFFNKEDALNIAISVYDTYWKHGHDKNDAHKHIEQIINNEEPFEVKDWFIDVLIKIGILTEKPKYDKIYDMDSLGVNYLSEIMPDIIKESTDITIIDSPVSSGKTTSIKMINDSLWMAEPYNPVIKNNFEGLSDSFQCLYDDIQFDEKQLTSQKNKIASSYNKLLNIDSHVFVNKNIRYLFIDESHTIFSDCEFRFEIMYELVHKIIDIAKLGVKVFLMTGTPLKEKELFTSCSELNVKYIKVKRNHKYKKELNVYKYITELYDEDNEKFKGTGFVLEEFISKKINEYKDKGYKILIPTNKGDKKIEKIMSRCAAIAGYSICDEEFNIYKRDYRNDIKNQMISKEGNMDNNIVFCTTYLSVGVSINNTEPACVIFFGNEWTAYQIEQYACRFRNTDITVIWIVNNNIANVKESSFKLIKIPSEEEIESIIECTKRELNFRGWENWDNILQRTLNAYPGIIKENMFEMNELYYDKISLYLSWYVYSLNKYYDNFSNNIKELNDYSFVIKEEEIQEKNVSKNYKDLYKENQIEINIENYNKLVKWIDYLDDYYFLQGKMEVNFYGEIIVKEPFITMHRFAMYCWHNGITVDNIKLLLYSCIIEKGNGYVRVENRPRYKRVCNNIEVAKKSIEYHTNRPKDNNSKRDIENANKKLEKYTIEKESLEETIYEIKTNNLWKIKKLIRIANHYHLENISRLVKFIKNEVDKVAIESKEIENSPCMNIESFLDELTEKYNKIVNCPKYINYNKYKYELKESIRDFINTLYDSNPLGVIIKTSQSINLPDTWFEIDKNRQKFDVPVSKEVRFLLDDIKVFQT